MKLTLVFLLCVVSVWSLPRVKRQMYGSINLKTIIGIMRNAAAVKTHCNCMMAPEGEEYMVCDRMGLMLREQFPKLARKGECPVGTTQEEREATVHIIQSLQDNYPHCWQRVIAHYKVTPEELEALEQFKENVKTNPGPVTEE